MNQVIKAIKLIDKDLDKYNKHQLDTEYEEQKEEPKSSLEQVIDVPTEFYYSRVVDSIRSNKTYFRSKSAKINQIHSNLGIIERMLFEDNRSIKYVAKWLRIPVKNINRTLRTYFKALVRHKKLSNQNQIKYKRMIAAKNQIALFIKSRAGR